MSARRTRRPRAAREQPRAVRDQPDDYRPAEGTPLLVCATCRANYLDDEQARNAHKIVFGHHPRPAKSTALARRDSKKG